MRKIVYFLLTILAVVSLVAAGMLAFLLLSNKKMEEPTKEKLSISAVNSAGSFYLVVGKKVDTDTKYIYIGTKEELAQYGLEKLEEGTTQEIINEYEKKWNYKSDMQKKLYILIVLLLVVPILWAVFREDIKEKQVNFF